VASRPDIFGAEPARPAPESTVDLLEGARRSERTLVTVAVFLTCVVLVLVAGSFLYQLFGSLLSIFRKIN